MSDFEKALMEASQRLGRAWIDGAEAKQEAAENLARVYEERGDHHTACHLRAEHDLLKPQQ